MYKFSPGGSILLPTTSEVWRGDTCGSTDEVQVKCTKIDGKYLDNNSAFQLRKVCKLLLYPTPTK